MHYLKMYSMVTLLLCKCNGGVLSAYVAAEL